jgi:hypothetical protein
MMMVAMMPTMPAIMMMMMTVMPPVHFRRRQPRIFLNGRRGAGIAERHRIRGCGEREERAAGSKSQNFRELHEISPSILCHVSAEQLAATLHAICRVRVECVLNERATNMNGSGCIAAAYAHTTGANRRHGDRVEPANDGWWMD